MNFFTADLHFGHANIIKYCSRPYSSVEEMDQALADNWNATVTDNDDVWILGDFTMKRDQVARNYLLQLKGRKHLILGNHDYFAFKHPEQWQDVLVDIMRYKELKLGSGYTFTMMHFPLLFWNDSGKPHSIMLYGHIHSMPYCNAIAGKLYNALNVGVDVSGYKPLSEKEVLDKVSELNQTLQRSINGPQPLSMEEIARLGY